MVVITPCGRAKFNSMLQHYCWLSFPSFWGQEGEESGREWHLSPHPKIPDIKEVLRLPETCNTGQSFNILNTVMLIILIVIQLWIKEDHWQKKRKQTVPFTTSTLVSFAAIFRVVTWHFSQLTAPHTSSAFLPLKLTNKKQVFIFWNLAFVVLLAANIRRNMIGAAGNNYIHFIGSYWQKERNAELTWADISGEEGCMTTLTTAPKETTSGYVNTLQAEPL